MRRIFLLSLFALVTAGGVAGADPHRSHSRSYPHSTYRPTYRHTYRSTYSRNYVRPYAHYARRPVYVQRPVVRYHYYDYYARPSLLVENYPPLDGYYWVAGQWQWNGYEWIWQPGHYEPYPVDSYYDY